MTSTIPYYINKKGKEVKLSISRHAAQRFIERQLIAFPGQPLFNKDIEGQITRYFSTSNKVKNLSRQEKTRLLRYGQDTMFFRTSSFTFVVKNSVIVTIELSDKKMRHLNN